MNLEETTKPEIEKMNKGDLKRASSLSLVLQQQITELPIMICENIKIFSQNKMKIAVVFTNVIMMKNFKMVQVKMQRI